MRRNDEYVEYVPQWRERSLSPMMSTSGGYAAPAFGATSLPVTREDIERVVNQFFGLRPSGLPATTEPQGTQTWVPRVDISQNDKEWCIEADLPGVKKEDVNVEVGAGYLILGAEMRPVDEPQGPQEESQGPQRQHTHRERRHGYFQRVLTLPDNLDEANINCDYLNGVLTVRVPKMEPRAPLQRRIPVGEGTQQGNGFTPREAPALAGVKGGEASAAKRPQGQNSQKNS